jgi:hypothetical protein
MTTVSPEQWRLFSEYLDQALDVPDTERGAWMTSLAQRHPQLAAAVADALALRDRAGYAEFLAKPPLPPEQMVRATLIGRWVGVGS